MKSSELSIGQQLNLISDNEWPFCDTPARVIAIKGYEVTLVRLGVGDFPTEHGWAFAERAKNVRPFAPGYGAINSVVA